MVNRTAIAVVGVWVVVTGCSYSPPAPAGDAATPPTVGFEFPTSGIDEGAAGTTGSTALVPVVLSKPSDTPITVDCSAISGGTAMELIDYSVVTHTVTFAPGITRVEVQVDVVKDFDETESAETIDIALSAPSGATLDETKAIHEITIADHILPRIRFDTATSTTSEGTQTMLNLMLDIPADGPSTVVIGVTPAAADGTDTEDLALVEGTTVMIDDGATMVQVPVGEVDDPFDEVPTETVTFELKGASQNLVVDAANKTRQHALTDNDDPPTVQFKLSTSNTAENAGTATIEVELSEESALPIAVSYARQSGDTATAADATVTGNVLDFAPRTAGVPGEKLKTISVTIVDDNIDEDAETVIVDLSAGPTNATLGGRTTHTMTILADATDPPAVVSWAATSSNKTEANTTHTITIDITPVSGKTITIPYTFGGTASISGSGNGNDDYDPNTLSPFDIPPDSATFTFRVDINDDTAKENPNETIIITLGTPTNGTLGTPSTHTVTILNDGD